MLGNDRKLYGLVNNAGVMGCEASVLHKTNFVGPQLMCEAFIGLLDPQHGRIVNMSSGLGPSYVSKVPEDEKAFWINPNVTFKEIA